MYIKQFFQRLLDYRKKKRSSNASSGERSEKVQKLMMMLSNTQEVELTCNDVFILLDQFAELAVQGEDVSRLMPLVQQHLDMCEDCREEFKVLERILHGTM